VTGPCDGPADATCSTPDEQRGLKPTWIATRADPNLAEQENVDRAVAWTLAKRPLEVLDLLCVRRAPPADVRRRLDAGEPLQDRGHRDPDDVAALLAFARS